MNDASFPVDDLDAEDSRRLVGIMTEFLNGFALMKDVAPSVTVFGSAQTAQNDPYYQMAYDLGGRLGREGISIITGGGPGIMEAANRGAFEAGGKSVGVAISLPTEQPTNRYMTKSMLLRHFFVRKVMLVKYSYAFALFPGGFGTLDELFEALTLIRTRRAAPFPLVMIGSEYWGGLVDWMRGNLLRRGYIREGDLNVVRLADSVDEAAAICREAIFNSKANGV
ncbi:MAG: TIGR00730 family Rossman fold protein [Nitrospinae bacterium]|nr:TIGR00730 family Rossman fold protein [Nitrospinota bacterium]